MDLHPGSDAAALQQATAEWLADNLPIEASRQPPPNLWYQLESMGWADLTRAEEAGGLGLDHSTEALVFAELGRHLAPLGLVASAVGRRWAGPEGKLALAIQSDEGAWRAFDPDGASQALAYDGETLRIVACPPGDLQPTIDLATMQRRIDGDGGTPIADPAAEFHLRLLLGAYAVGAAEAARDMAVAYAQVREQFGQPIGSFQAIKHICADVAVACATARSMLYYAACALQEDAPDAAFHIASLELLAQRAAIDAARANIQVHGGIGMTDEAHAHLPLKRAHLLIAIAPTDYKAMLDERPE